SATARLCERARTRSTDARDCSSSRRQSGRRRRLRASSRPPGGAASSRTTRGPTATGRAPGSSAPAEVSPNSSASIYNAPRVDLFSQPGGRGDAMLSRRAFLERGSLALAAMSLHAARAADAPVGPLGKPIGLQLYTVRDAVAKDLPGTLRALAGIGYREVELAGIAPISAKDLRKILTDCGLTAPSMHASMADLQTGLQQRIDYAKAIGAEYLVCAFPWTADSRFRDNPGKAVLSLASGINLDDWKWNADQLNRIAVEAAKSGLRVGYHNHNMEFRSYDGVVAYD